MKGLVFDKLYAVYNPILVSSFCLARDKLFERMQNAPEMFFNEKWRRDKKTVKRREQVIEKFRNKVNIYLWNRTQPVHLVVSSSLTISDSYFAGCTRYLA
jgi:hypothetical protein